MTNPDLIALANELDDIETDAAGKCNWSEVATVSDALRRLASSDGGMKVRELEWTIEKRYGYDVHVGRGTGLMYEAAIKAYSPGWVVAYGGETILNSDDADEDAAKAAAQADYEARIRSALITAPPADAGMRPTTEDILERINTELSTMAESWVGAFSGLSDGDDVAEYLTGTVWANLATAIDALTAPGATTKSDGGEVITAEQMDAIEKAAVAGRPLTDPDWKQDQAETTRIRPSNPSSTRSEVTVEELAALLGGSIFGTPDDQVGPATRDARNGYRVKAARVLDQFEIRKRP